MGCLLKTLSSINIDPLFFAERWLSGRKHVPAKDAYPLNGIEGSNPSLSVSLLVVLTFEGPCQVNQ